MDSSAKVRICFLADRHGLYDDRIYWKMAVPLVDMGWKVNYILIGTEEGSGKTAEGVEYQTLRVKTFSSNRYLNFLAKRFNPGNNYKKMFCLARETKADIYHLHDLWVNRIGVRLKDLKHRPVVFYDAREPYAADLRTLYKTGAGWVTNLFAAWVDRWEKKKAGHYDLVIANEEKVRDAFRRKLGNERAVVLYNYPDMHEKFIPVAFNSKEYDLIYCGGMTYTRGAMRMLRVVNHLKVRIPNVKLLLLGKIDPEALRIEMEKYIEENNLENNVSIHEPVSYGQVSDFYNRSRIGLLLWDRLESLEIKLPIKLFEYMTFGLPIVGSDFGQIGAYIKRDSCGIAVEQDREELVGEAIFDLLTKKELYREYSANALERSHREYRWETEFQKLTGFYEKALRKRVG